MKQWYPLYVSIFLSIMNIWLYYFRIDTGGYKKQGDFKYQLDLI